MSEAKQHEKNQGKEDLLTDLQWFVKYVKPYSKLIFGALVLALITSAAKTGRGALIKPLMDEGLLKEKMDQLYWIAGAVLVLSVTGSIGIYFYRYLSMYIKEKIMLDIRMEVFEHLIYLPLGFFSSRKKGDLISRTTNDIKVTRAMVRTIVGKMLLKPFEVVTALVVALLASWQLTIIVLCASSSMLFLFKRFGRQVRKSKKESLLKFGDIVESLQQMLSGIRIIKAFQGEKNEIDRFRDESEVLLNRNMNVIKNKALSKSTSGVLKGVMLTGAMLAGSWLIVSDKAPFSLTIGGLMQFLFAMGLLYQPLQKMIKAYMRIQETRAGVERLRELLQKDRVIDDDSGKIGEDVRYEQLPELSEGIDVRDVQFSYDEEPVLKDISLRIDAGETVALVGPSGAGKSTLIDLIGRFYLPDSGEILFDGVPVREMDRTKCMQFISVVSQQSFLFNSTIEENIRYGNPEASEEKIIEAAETAYIHDFITSLPEGYQTTVGERGVRISGGQRQRISIARALLKEADLLLLDEATSNLDTKSENIIQRALERLLEERTCVVIAHRLSTVRNADRIYVMENGRIKESGTHDELIVNEGLYSSFYHQQLESHSE